MTPSTQAVCDDCGRPLATDSDNGYSDKVCWIALHPAWEKDHDQRTITRLRGENARLTAIVEAAKEIRFTAGGYVIKSIGGDWFAFPYGQSHGILGGAPDYKEINFPSAAVAFEALAAAKEGKR